MKVAELFWGRGNPFAHTFDVLLGADLTYDFEDLEPLVQTCEALTHTGSKHASECVVGVCMCVRVVCVR